ncbi:MAG: hypothetical protein R6W76_02725 [Caldilinea sp.]
MGLSTGEFLVDDVRLAYRTNGSGALLLILPGNTASSAYHVSYGRTRTLWRAISRCFAGLPGNSLGEIRCPVLVTASLGDGVLPDTGASQLALLGQIPDTNHKSPIAKILVYRTVHWTGDNSCAFW